MSYERHLKRLGFWLRMAREHSGKSQEGAARELGLSASSKSTISDWENGVREPRLSQLRELAHYYDVPLELLVNPPSTAFEELQRVKELAAAALEAEEDPWGGSWDWRSGQEAEDGGGEPPGTQQP